MSCLNGHLSERFKCAEGGEHDLQASDVNNGDRSFSSAIPNNVWPFTSKLRVCTETQGLQTNQIPNTSAGMKIHCSDDLPAPQLAACHFCMTDFCFRSFIFFPACCVCGFVRRSAKLLTFSLPLRLGESRTAVTLFRM